MTVCDRILLQSARVVISLRRSRVGRLYSLAWLLLAASIAAGDTAGSVARGGDFQIHTKVFVADAAESASENRTYFRGQRVYDCTSQPEEIAVFDPTAGKMVLLRPATKQRADLTLNEVDDLVDKLRRKLTTREDEFSGFLVNPMFQRQTDSQTGELSFRSPWLHYRVQAAAAPDDDVAQRYSAFSAYFTRLNTLRRPVQLGRAAVNEVLSEQKLIPRSVRLATYQRDARGNLAPSGEFRSEHAVTWSLTAADHRRLDEIDLWMTNFSQLRLTDFWEADPRVK